MRRLNPSLVYRLCSGWKAGLSTIVGLSSVFGFILVIYPICNSFWFTPFDATVIVLLFGFSVAFFSGKHKHLPSTMIDELSGENTYTAMFCSQAGLKEADELTKPCFGRDFIPFQQIEQWRLKNGKGFVQINNGQNQLCACFVIIGLTHSFLDEFIVGRLTEHDIDSSAVLSFEEMKREERVYISGVVVKDAGNYKGHKRANIMIWTMLQYIKKVFGLRKARIFYAVALTAESEKLLKAMQFELLGFKNTRKDQSNLYKIELDKKKYEELVARVGDYSKMVNLDFQI